MFRTWGFNDKNVTYDADGLPQYGNEGAGETDVVFQWWNNGKSTIDLTAFDKVVNAATKVGIKLIVTLTNNWADYGGMDVYTVNLGGQYHDDVSRPSNQRCSCMCADVKFLCSSTGSRRLRLLTSVTSKRW